MSGWTDFSSLAKSATSLAKSAQKRIDKVLDIKEEGEGASSVSGDAAARLQDDFFTAFGLTTSVTGPSTSAKEEPSTEEGTTPAPAAASLSSATAALGGWFGAKTSTPDDGSTKKGKSWSSWLGATGADDLDKESDIQQQPENSVQKAEEPEPVEKQQKLEPQLSIESETAPEPKGERRKKKKKKRDNFQAVPLMSYTESEIPENPVPEAPLLDLGLPTATEPSTVMSTSSLLLMEEEHGLDQAPLEPTMSEPILAPEVMSGSTVDWGQSGWTRSTVQMEVDGSVILNQPLKSSAQLTAGSMANSSSGSTVEKGDGSSSLYDSSLEDSETRSQSTVVDAQPGCLSPSMSDLDSSLSLPTGPSSSHPSAVSLAEELERAYLEEPAPTPETEIIPEENFSAEIEEPPQEANLIEVEEDTAEESREAAEAGPPIISEPLSVLLPTPGVEDGEMKTPVERLEGSGSEGSGEGERASSSSIADSFVRLEPGEGSPPLSQQKSETSSVVIKGSGYTSPTDDLETAASSDIEVISTTNGDNMSERSSRSGIIVVDHSKVREWRGSLSQEVRDGHRRSGSDADFLVSSHPGGSSDLAQVMKTLEAREAKVVDLSRENAQLVEENQDMRVSLQQLQIQMKSSEEMEKALSNLQEKFSAMHEEKEAYRQRCERLEREESSSGSTVAHLQRLLKEKEEQIADFTKEGEKLSKRELKHSSIIKKLREKEKDTEKLVESQKQKLEEMEAIRSKLKEKGQQEITYDEAIHQLKSTTEKQEKKILRQQAEIEDWQEKCNSLKTTADSCYKQIAELTREIAAKESSIQKLESIQEASKEAELGRMLDETEKRVQAERQDFTRQIEELRLNLIQASEEADRREAGLRWETTQLQKKLEEAENRNQELSEEVRAATKPLLRQIESLQSSHGTQEGNWERLEKALYDRIHDAEKKSFEAAEKEREMQTALLEARSRMTQAKAELNAAQKEKALLEEAVESHKMKVKAFDELKDKKDRELERERRTHLDALREAEREKEMVAEQGEAERKRLKSQMEDRVKDLLQQLERKEQALSNLRSELLEKVTSAAVPPSPSVNAFRGFSEQRSVSPSIASFNPDESGDDLWSWGETGAGLGTLVEKLRERVQTREGEAGVMREELRIVQQSRDSATAQLAQMGSRIHEMEERLKDMTEIQAKYKELDSKYQALLQMFGEKVEENEELRLDLQDVKSMYRQQIQDLLNSER